MSFKTVAMPPQMKQNRPNQPGPERDTSAQQQPQRPRNPKPGQWPFSVRAGISLLLVWHLAALFLAPLSIQPSSPLVIQVAQQPPMQWYLDALYLNHGYHFFAPEPSNGHLIQYELFDERGGKIAEGKFPDRKEYWPRLLYHRYFMLADQCEVPSQSEGESRQWKQAYLSAYAQQLLREHEGSQARVWRAVHYPAFVDDVVRGMPLDDKRTYENEEPIVTERRQNLTLPTPNQNGAWNTNWRQDVASGWQGGAR